MIFEKKIWSLTLKFCLYHVDINFISTNIESKHIFWLLKKESQIYTSYLIYWRRLWHNMIKMRDNKDVYISFNMNKLVKNY